MERLIQWIDKKAIPRVDLRNCGYEKCATQLARYEDTDLTPEQIMKLKERDTAKAPSDQDENFGYFECPNCGMAIYVSDDFESHRFCLNCGQRIKWKEDIDGK